MREILFRGIDKSSCKWVYGDLLQRDEGRKIKAIMPQYPAKKGIVVKEDSIGQYTGLNDKNGTKIFEGDIVKRQWGEYPFQYVLYVVQFSFGEFELKAINTKEKMFISYHYECEIIGNIYDNPDLLERIKNDNYKENDT